MKLSLILITLVSLTTTSAQAVTLFCANSVGDRNRTHVLEHNFLRNEVRANCQSADMVLGAEINEGRLEQIKLFEGEAVNLNMSGVGPGFRLSLVKGFIVECPLIFKAKNLYKAPFYGIKMEAGAVVTAQVGLIANRRFGVCTISGLSAGAGFDLSGVKATFTDRYQDSAE